MVRHLRLATLVALFIVIPAVAAFAAPFAYITNSVSGNISVVDVATNTQVDVIALPAGAVPWGMAIHPQGKTLYVTHFGNGMLYVVDLSAKTAQGYAAGSLPFGVAVHPNGTKVFVSRGVLMGNNLAVFDSTTFARTDVLGGLLPAGVATNGTSGHVYVANLSGVRVLNMADNSFVATVSLGSRGFGVAVHPQGHRFYVTLPNANKLALVDATSPFAFSTVNVGSTPQGVAVSPDGKLVYVANHGGSSVTVLDENGGFVHTATVGTKPYGVQVSPDGGRVLVANWGSNNVSVINVSVNNTVPTFAVSTVALGTFPPGLAPVGFGISMLPSSAISVGIDIMPVHNPNEINLKAQGKLQVAILGSADFSVATVDPYTVTVAGAPVLVKKDGPMAVIDDVNNDGFVDLVVQVAIQGLQLQLGDKEAVVEGKTYDGLAIRGTDSVLIVHGR